MRFSYSIVINIYFCSSCIRIQGEIEVRNVKKGLIILVVIVILIPIIFKTWFVIAMDSAGRAKPINISSVKTYKTHIKKEFSDINYISFYHRFGRINFDFTAYRKSICPLIVIGGGSYFK